MSDLNFGSLAHVSAALGMVGEPHRPRIESDAFWYVTRKSEVRVRLKGSVDEITEIQIISNEFDIESAIDEYREERERMLGAFAVAARDMFDRILQSNLADEFEMAIEQFQSKKLKTVRLAQNVDGCVVTLQDNGRNPRQLYDRHSRTTLTLALSKAVSE